MSSDATQIPTPEANGTQEADETTNSNNTPTPPAREIPLVATRGSTNLSVAGIDPSQYNQRNPAVKRLLREAAELATPDEDFYARPLEDNLFEWHFTIRGAQDSDYAHGVYHGRIILPPEYPMKPPSIILLTPNGRFETGTKICLSISSYHPETWRPSWSIRTALVALISFMTTDSPGAIGSLEMAPDVRRKFAIKSQSWECPECGRSTNYINSRPVPLLSRPNRIFRLPHDPHERFDGGEIAAINVVGDIGRGRFDARAGDPGRIQIAPPPILQRPGDDDDGNDGDVEDEIDTVEEYVCYFLQALLATGHRFAVRSVILCIFGLLLRRLLLSGYLDSVFE